LFILLDLLRFLVSNFNDQVLNLLPIEHFGLVYLVTPKMALFMYIDAYQIKVLIHIHQFKKKD
jgi:hypothetical protein